MTINYNKHRRTIEKSYEDKCTISRYKKGTDPISKETKLELKPVYEDKPCRISQRSLGANGQTEAHNQIQYETKLFIAPELEIKQGDEIVVSRAGITRYYQAGEPFVYPSHQEVSIQRRDRA